MTLAQFDSSLRGKDGGHLQTANSISDHCEPLADKLTRFQRWRSHRRRVSPDLRPGERSKDVGR